MRPWIVMGTLLMGTFSAQAADWPGWRGPGRDGQVSGYTAPAKWPEKLTPGFKVEVGLGHSSPVVAGDRVFIHSRQGDDEVVSALALADGKVLWRKTYPAPYQMNPAATGHGPGPKATPAVADGRLYTLGISGILSAWDTASGELAWRKEFGGKFKHTSPLFGASASPLVDGGRVVVAVGGHDSGALIAFDAKSGAELWSRAEEGPGYASPVVMELGGVRQVVTQMQSSVVGVAAGSGELLWRIPFDTAYFQNIVTPLVVGDRLIYSGLDKGTTAVKPIQGEAGFKMEPVWHSDEVALYMSSPIRVGDRICGLSHKKKGQLFCLDAASGKTLWTNEGRVGDNAAVYAAGSVLLVVNDGGELIVANASGATYQELARYDLAPKATWSSPAVVGKTLLVKDYDSLISVSLP